MPEYSYKCDKCAISFNTICSIQSYKEHIECGNCGSLCSRDYDTDLPTIQTSIKLATSEIKTLGHLAQRNTETMSQDQKDELYRKHNAYREDAPEKPLPKGMTRLKKQQKIQWTDNPGKKRRKLS